jgi:ADP-ribose pyrophosphatase YjhB (NUDIX family)
MISFRLNSHRFHLRAGAIVMEAGHVLLHRLEGDPFWALPGGRVEAGEECAQTIVREFKEELGLNVTCNELLSVGENFFEYEGEPHHEIGLYFSVSLPAAAEVRDTGKSHIGIEENKRLEFGWFTGDALRELDFRPAALQASLAEGKVRAHFVQHN